MIESSTNWRVEKEKGAWLTIGEALFGLVALAAASLRLTNLDAVPLSPAEAEAALAVWQFWQPGTTAVLPTSPAYFSLTAVLTQILGFSDVVMRLVPALFGVALTLLPWLLRHRLGMVGALVTAVFLAISPITVVVARTAGGDSIALFATLLLLLAWVRRQDSGDGRWTITIAAALGLGFASAPLFYSGLFSLLLVWLWQMTIGPRFNTPAATEEPEGGWATAVNRQAALSGALIFLALTTTFLLNLSGLGAAATQLGDWLAQFGRAAAVGGVTTSGITPFLAVMRYEPLLLVLGLAALTWAIWHGDSLGRLALYWLVGIGAVLLLQQGTIANAALAPLAGYLLLGSFAGRIIGSHIHQRGWALTAGLLLVGALIFVNISRYVRVSLFQPMELSHVWVAIMGLTLALTTIYFLITWDHRSTYQGILLSLLALFFFYQWGTAWWMGQQGANDPRERWVTTATHDSTRRLADHIGELSWQLARYENGVDILSSVESPVLAWYLRDFAHLQMGAALPPAANSSLIITTAVEPALGDEYMGTAYTLLRLPAVVESPAPASILETLRWWLFQESTAVPQEQRVILWLRADLAQ